MVLFNRSWYNRAGVERVMGFCTDEEHASFIEQVAPFEQMLIRSGIQILKYYLDIGRKEQKRRLRQRAVDPLKQWKVSPIRRRRRQALGGLYASSGSDVCENLEPTFSLDRRACR